MVITFGVITGAGIGTSAIATTPPALKWFPPEKKGYISGVVLGGVALSAVFYSPLVNCLLQELGISVTFIILGVGVGTAMVLLARFLVNPPAGYSLMGTNAASPQTPTQTPDVKDLNWKDLIKRSDFYKLWLIFAFSSTAGLMVYGHATNIAKIQAHWEGGYLLVIFMACLNLIGRMAGGTVSDIIGRINVIRLVLGLQALNMLVFSNFTTIPLLCVGVAVAGVCYGAAFAVVAAALADFYGLKYYGVNYGLIYTAWGTGGIIGPMTAASIFDATQSYNTGYLVACVLLLIALGIAISFKISPAEAEGARRE